MAPDLTQRQVEILAVVCTFGFVASTTVGLRLISRHLQRVRLGASDWTILAAWPFLIGGLVANIVGTVAGGLGRHQDELSLDQTRVYLKAIYAIQLLWAATLGLTKTSICLFYMSLFPTRKFKIASYLVIAVCNAFALAVILGTVLICVPLNSSYEPSIQARCGDRVSMWVVIGVFNITTDLLVVYLPLPVLWGLNLPLRRRLELCVLFSLGTFVCVVSGIRLKFLLDVKFGGDASYQIGLANIWSWLEISLAMTVGCIPVLRPLLLRLRGRQSVAPSSGRNTHSHDQYVMSTAQTWKQLSGQEGPSTTVTTVSTLSGSNHHPSSEDVSADQPRRNTGNGIEVTRTWEVTHVGAGSFGDQKA